MPEMTMVTNHGIKGKIVKMIPKAETLVSLTLRLEILISQNMQ